ncbi:MAG: 2,5-diketo-D-gluconate reductase B [Candidatus Latescibacterota bacterium]|jgi:2,5-diketo-D-gluconate reductase B
MLHTILPSKQEMPMLGLGTFDLQGEEGARSVEAAIRHGYRHLDTAVGYDNHDAVGQGIAYAETPREELFVTSKIPREKLAYDDVLSSCEQSLRELGLSYLDLFLVHWPNNEIPLADTLRALAHLLDTGQVKNVGLSNFTTWRLREALELDLVPIAVNQVEYHVYLNQEKLRSYCAENAITLVAYSPLAQGALLQDETLAKIADSHKKTTAQIALRWLLEKGIGAIPRSQKPARQATNFDLFDFSLSALEIEHIDAIEKIQRVIEYWPGEFEKGE